MTQSTVQSDKRLQHLAALVSFDTQNPPRAISAESEIFCYLKENLPGFDFQLLDAGEGSLSLLAQRGNPRLLFNFHIDTVPIAEGWKSNPLELIVTPQTAIGLGACDIKGAAACMLSAASQTQGDLALLFSSDEEHGSSAAIKQFLTTEHGFTEVIVAEPTHAKAILAHRGIQSAKVVFSGISGHASEARAMQDSAIHKATQWCAHALDWVKEQDEQFDSLQGLPFNIGTISGGIKANMIASNCEIALGFRPLPGQDSAVLLEQLKQVAISKAKIKMEECKVLSGFKGPTLPAANQDFNQAIQKAKQLATTQQIPIGNAVNFWTEASLFSEAGLTALVYGPGDIAQAHTANEWVALEQLAEVEQAYIQMIDKPY
ncbi:acetylornithine deacetylase [Aliikangiella sp. IMCC44359]|uniref:acetylornithine deacetylase n=1 Tax=Aliikangiella sp. IMCC44359 TaxID=3459125 RepID=UPI00403B25AF